MASLDHYLGQDSRTLRLTYLLLSPTFGMHQYTADLANRVVGHHAVQLVTTAGFPRDRYNPAVEASTPVALGTSGFSAETLALGRLRQVRQVLAQIEPDLVHLTGPHPWNVDLLRWLRTRGVPTIHTLHDLDPHPGKRYGRLLHYWNWLVIRNADHILVHGQSHRQRLIEMGLPSETVTATPLLHLFLGHARITELEQSLPPISYEPLILFFGRLEEYKGVETLLGAIDVLSEYGRGSHALKPQLVIASSSRRPNRKQETRDGIVWFCPLKDDNEAERLFRRCGLLVLPYKQASQSALIAAAYYFHKPVVASRVGALAEYVVDGRTGLLIPPEDPQALAGALSRMLASRTRLQAMGKAGREWYDRARDQETKTLRELYERVAIRSS
jgi:glycosyltransferase involved in cell wall biosynthesis